MGYLNSKKTAGELSQVQQVQGLRGQLRTLASTLGTIADTYVTVAADQTGPDRAELEKDRDAAIGELVGVLNNLDQTRRTLIKQSLSTVANGIN